MFLDQAQRVESPSHLLHQDYLGQTSESMCMLKYDIFYLLKELADFRMIGTQTWLRCRAAQSYLIVITPPVTLLLVHAGKAPDIVIDSEHLTRLLCRLLVRFPISKMYGVCIAYTYKMIK